MHFRHIQDVFVTNFTTSTWHRCFAKNAKLCIPILIDLTYHIEYDDIMKRDISRFDTSDYSSDNVYGILLTNKKVPGLER